MGKTYEALERAEKEHEEKWLIKAGEPRDIKAVTLSPRRVDRRNSTRCYEELKTNLLAGHPRESIKTILFSGTNHGDGSSTTAVNFAYTLAADYPSKVLLMDVNLRTPSLHEVFHLEPDNGLSDLGNNGKGTDSLLKKADRGNLYIVTCGSSQTGPVSLFESMLFCEFLHLMKDKFDFVILDGPPVPSFSETRVLCSKVDGVILVLAAGRTREQVAKRAKREIEEAGGKILGLVLNRRKFHIPEWIYRRL